MWKGLIAGAVALAAVGSSLALGTEFERNAAVRTRAHAAGVSITPGRIAHVKAMLHLTPEQERHWAPFEAALRDYMRRQSRVSASGDGSGADSGQIHQLGSAAMPLIMSLDEGQKQKALRVAYSMGLGKIIAMY
jgi:hypothetical protein